jgi:hypothetical protein
VFGDLAVNKAYLSMNTNKAMRDVKSLKVTVRSNIMRGVMGIIGGRTTPGVETEKIKLFYKINVCFIRIVREYDAEEDIWTEEGRGDREMEKTT